MGAADNPPRGGEEKEFIPLEPRRRSNRVVAPRGGEGGGDGRKGESFAMQGVVESRMMGVAARRIVQLEQALEESRHANAVYEDKIANLHRHQMYTVDRMGKRIDVLEEELMCRTAELERTQQELHKAVEKVVTLQQEVSQHQDNESLNKKLMMIVELQQQEQRQEQNKATTTTTKRPQSSEERSYPSSAGSEGQFEGISRATKMLQKSSSKKKNKKNKKNKNKRCKVESTWDDAVIVPDSFMTAVDDSSSTRSTRVVVSNKAAKQKDATAGLSRFFRDPFGQKQKETDNGIAKWAVRPNVIEDFYESSSNGSSLPGSIRIGGR